MGKTQGGWSVSESRGSRINEAILVEQKPPCLVYYINILAFKDSRKPSEGFREAKKGSDTV